MALHIQTFFRYLLGDGDGPPSQREILDYLRGRVVHTDEIVDAATPAMLEKKIAILDQRIANVKMRMRWLGVDDKLPFSRNDRFRFFSLHSVATSDDFRQIQVDDLKFMMRVLRAYFTRFQCELTQKQIEAYSKHAVIMPKSVEEHTLKEILEKAKKKGPLTMFEVKFAHSCFVTYVFKVVTCNPIIPFDQEYMMKLILDRKIPERLKQHLQAPFDLVPESYAVGLNSGGRNTDFFEWLSNQLKTGPADYAIGSSSDGQSNDDYEKWLKNNPVN